jgi:hypothetical protein
MPPLGFRRTAGLVIMPGAMALIKQIYLLCGLLVAAGALPVAAADDPGREAIEYRQRIRSGVIDLTQDTYDIDGSKRQLARSRRTSIFFDAKHARVDMEIRYNPDVPFHREVFGHNCEVADSYMAYTEQRVEGGLVALKFSAESQGDNSQALSRLVDPRLLGMIAQSSPNLATRHLEDVIGRTDRQKYRVEHAEWAGENGQRMLFHLPIGNGVDVEALTVAKYGPSIVRIATSWKSNQGERFRRSVDTDYSYNKDAALWFPSRCTFREESNGAPKIEETVAVHVRSINLPLDSSTFSLKGIGVKAATPLVGYGVPTSGYYEWDGSAMVKIESQGAPTVGRPAGQSRNWLILRIVALNTAVVLSLGAYWLFKRKRAG